LSAFGGKKGAPDEAPSGVKKNPDNSILPDQVKTIQAQAENVISSK
jgi:hypothetical protein